MKRVSLALVFACIVTALAAQTIKVNYQGAKPSISDFAWALLSDYENNAEDTDESTAAMLQAWKKYRKGTALPKNETLTVDKKSGYVVFESTFENQKLRIEMCYWNEADGKHKLIAYNVGLYIDGKYNPGQYDGLFFYRYADATKKMTYLNEAPGFEVQYCTDDGSQVSYTLPRTGKDITMTTWNLNGTTKQKTLKWNGSKFAK